MQLIAPDLYSEVSYLSMGACLIGFFIGFGLWLTGWWQHRFWVVVSLTAAAGIYGLQSGRTAGSHPMVAGLLAALAAGCLAMELARLLAFVGGGALGSYLVRTYLPTLHEPLLAFLAGGLLAVVLFRLWMLCITALLGSLVMTYTALALLGRWTNMDGPNIVAQSVGMLNGVVIVGGLVGLVAQGKFDSWRSTSGKRMKDRVLASFSEAERNALKKAGNKQWALTKFLKPKKAG